jgi:endoglucanase
MALFQGSLEPNPARARYLQALNRRVVAVGTVQEEVGLRGARVAAWQVDPQYGLALEGSITADVPGSKPHQISAKLQSGPVIAIADQTTLTHPTIFNTLIQVGKQHNIPYQFKKLPEVVLMPERSI